jgi:hypothetical protein
VFLGLLSAGIALYSKGQALAVPTDRTSLCPTKQVLSQVTVILLDVSDDFSEPQKLQVANYLDRVRDSIPRFGLLELYTLDRAGGRVTEPVFHMCNPGSGADLNKLYQNPHLAKKAWQAFTHRVSEQLERQIAAPPSSTSPIFEAVQATALRTFGRPEFDRVPKRLVVVSDLLQNVPGGLSMYAAIPRFDSFQSSPYFSGVRSDLQGVSVSIYYLARAASNTQGRSHIDFWDSFFAAQGAAVESVQKVYGDR